LQETPEDKDEKGNRFGCEGGGRVPKRGKKKLGKLGCPAWSGTEGIRRPVLGGPHSHRIRQGVSKDDFVGGRHPGQVEPPMDTLVQGVG